MNVPRLLSFIPLVVSTLSAATYYVAPNGNDTNGGSIEAPFATVQRAQQAVRPGDTVYLRGGTYVMTNAHLTRDVGVYSCVTFLDKSGEEGKPIRYWAYPGERPVIDMSQVKPEGRRVTAFRVEGSWLHLKGFEVVGLQVTILTHTQSINFDNQGSHNLYEQLSAHDGKGIGFWIGNGSHNLVLNCDAYRNHDDVSADRLGGNSDGFGYHGPRGSVNNVFRGCRAWFNSDDGFDFINSGEAATAENCWAFYNGYSVNFSRLANGAGFKAGGYGSTPAERVPRPIPRHRVIGSLAVRNKAVGFYANHHVGGVEFVNNSAHRNPVNFNMLGREADNRTDIPGRGHILKNNLGYAAGNAEVAQLNAEASDAGHNSFDLPLALKSDDFMGLDESDLVKPRQPNGDLPQVAFMKLRRGSAAIDRGTDVGRPYTGRAPDLGAFEYRD